MIDPHCCDGKGCLCHKQTGYTGDTHSGKFGASRLKPKLDRYNLQGNELVKENNCDGHKPHFHKNEQGEMVKCFHECKSILRQPAFWVITTLSFPIEHGLWSLIYGLLGIGH